MSNIRIMFHSMPRRWTIYIDDEVILCNLLRLVWAKMPWLRLINVPRGHELKYSLYILKHCRLAKTFRQNELTVRLCALEFQNFPVNAPMSLHEHQPWAPLVCMSALWVPISAPSVYYRTSHQGTWFEANLPYWKCVKRLLHYRSYLMFYYLLNRFVYRKRG